MQRLLDPGSERQLSEARELLGDLRETLARLGATASDRETLGTSIRQLDQLFLIVVVGEFNAGKSALINGILGQEVMREGVTPTTSRIQLLTWGPQVADDRVEDGVRVLTAPLELLRDLQIVDTPGTNAIFREHERLTGELMPRADFVLFVTSADRPFTETERQFLATIHEWGKKVLVVVNKIDLVSTADEREQILAFVREGALGVLGQAPPVLGVSARLARLAKQGEASLWPDSGFEPLERYLTSALDAGRRFRLKLENPLRVGLALANRYAALAGERLTMIQDDVRQLEDDERQLAQASGEMHRGFELRMSLIDKVLGDMEARGHAFFEDMLRIARVVDLLNRPRIQKAFEDTVVADTPHQVEQRVRDLVDWMVDQDLGQWQAVSATLAGRQERHADRMLGSPDVGTFHRDRARLIDTVQHDAQRIVDTYDKQREAAAIADQARVAVAASAAAGGAAIGLGTLVTVAASTVTADLTGMLAASFMLGVGLLILPARRRRARGTLHEKVAALRQQLTNALRGAFERTRTQHTQRLADAIGPYARFVRAEEQRWTGAQGELGVLRERVRGLLDQLARDDREPLTSNRPGFVGGS
ncbi:MAG: dynamin family protein [Vicinamibacterales bacterium]